ncbi:hypothetical protein GHT06_019222 [Daphnia sinensis]|uniref:Major facilitator superfamily (MFS) profile domain-containing protein n=1 Tax=Daphnia sinensis TaxID=1820382 RepID=A0AAD5PNB8_9CRUS|nr:hypothetical protein GHT06_019222 [Daphnia sinensis]
MTHGAPAKKTPTNDDEEVVPPPDGGWGWAVVFGSFMIHIIADGFTYTLGIFIVELMWYFDEGSERTSWIASIMVGVTLGSGPIVSSLVNKYGCRTITIVGALIAAFGLGISTLANGVTTLYVTIGLLAGFGFGLIYLPAIVSVTCYFEKKRSFATGIAVCGSGIGTFIFAPLTEALINTYGWRGALLIVTAITLNCIIFGALFRPLETTRPRRKRTTSEMAVEMVEKEKLMAINEESDNSPTDSARRSVHDIAANGETRKIDQDKATNNTLTVSTAVGDASLARMARSQPHLLQVPGDVAGEDNRKFGSYGNLPSNRDAEMGMIVSSRKGSTAETRSHHGGSGVMYRKDALYSGSMLNIPEYRADPKGFSGSVMRIPDDAGSGTTNENEKVKVCGLIPCSKESYDAYKEMMDFGLLKDPVFILFTVSNFCTSIGFNVPYVYIKDKALELGIPSANASFLLSVVGIANTVGRVILGYISDKPWLNRLWLYNGALTICGLATAFSAFCDDYVTLIVYCATFGFTIGAYVGLTSVILVDLLGLEKLTNAFGLLLLFQGIASLVGPPIAGRLKDNLGSYDAGFYLAGSMIAASGLMLFFIPCLQRWTKSKTKVADVSTKMAPIH